MMNPDGYFKSLSDDTRLRIILLTLEKKELCVCELTAALDIAQPKISRHLALLRNNALLVDERRGQWIYYRINPDLPHWVSKLLQITSEANPASIRDELKRLDQMAERPGRTTALCC